MAVFDEAGDLAWDEDWVWSEEIDALAQQIALGFVCILGTWFYDTTQGFPLLTVMFTNSRDLFLADSAIRDYLESFEGVTVIDLKITPVRDADSGKVLGNVEFTCSTPYGELHSDDIYLPQFQDL